MTPIYPAFVPGLRVRHRETLEERTVSHPSGIRVAFDDGYSVIGTLLWRYYEPLPQPGNRVRVVRAASGCGNECIGRTGTLRGRDSIGDYSASIHYGPLSDFEVILPEESETNMTENETVAVPVELLKRMAINIPSGPVRAEAIALIPKPKPRLVAVDLDGDWDDQLNNGPDLLATLKDAITEWWPRDQVSAPTINALIQHLSKRLGVTDER